MGGSGGVGPVMNKKCLKDFLADPRLKRLRPEVSNVSYKGNLVFNDYCGTVVEYFFGSDKPMDMWLVNKDGTQNICKIDGRYAEELRYREGPVSFRGMYDNTTGMVIPYISRKVLIERGLLKLMPKTLKDLLKI